MMPNGLALSTHRSASSFKEGCALPPPCLRRTSSVSGTTSSQQPPPCCRRESSSGRVAVGAQKSRSCAAASVHPEEEAQPAICIICYDEFDRRRAPHRIPCGCQDFDREVENPVAVHYGCIRAWAAQKASCPLCRAPLTVAVSPFIAPAGLSLSELVSRPLSMEAGVVQCFVCVTQSAFGSPVYDLFLEGPTLARRKHLLTASWSLECGLRASYVISLPAGAERVRAKPVARANANFFGTSWSVVAEPIELAAGAPSRARARAEPTLTAATQPAMLDDAADGPMISPAPATVPVGGGAGRDGRWKRRAAAVDLAAAKPRSARQELAYVRYKPNRFCIDSGPRTMSLVMPAVSEDGDLEDEPNAPLDTERALARALSSRVVDDEGAHVSTFKNRSPIWDERYQAYVLNFMGRVRIASVKNFQIVQQDNVANETLLQFGRVSSTVFSMDVQWPLSIVQAFGVCLTSISTKLGVK